jgi:hypothetical protein
MDLTDEERRLILAGPFELTITHAEDDDKRERCKALARKLGGDPEAMFFGADRT